MLDAEADKALLAQRLREFADGGCTFEEVERVAYEIRDRWSGGSHSELPPEADTELPLWAAVWDITSSCRDSLVSASGAPAPVLRHIEYLEGTERLPSDWSARRP